MEVPTRALLIIKGTSSWATVSGAKNTQAMQKVLSGLPVTVDCVQSEVMRVQYNPPSLSIRAHAQNTKVNSMWKPGEIIGVRQEEELPSTELSVKLVFTTVGSRDAFMADRFRLSAGDAVSDGVVTAKAVSGGYTVRPQIDELVGVVMDMGTKGVAFVWQDMVFEGRMSSLRSSHNMFSISGNSINGSVDMSTTQNINKAPITAWDKALGKCFTSGAAGKNSPEKAGSLINLNL